MICSNSRNLDFGVGPCYSPCFSTWPSYGVGSGAFTISRKTNPSISGSPVSGPLALLQHGQIFIRELSLRCWDWHLAWWTPTAAVTLIKEGPASFVGRSTGSEVLEEWWYPEGLFPAGFTTTVTQTREAAILTIIRLYKDATVELF